MLVDAGSRRRPRPRLRLAADAGGGMRGVSALVIGAPRGLPAGELYRQGMRGMGAGTSNIVDALTGGKASEISAKLSRVEAALKLSTVASVVAAAITVFGMFRRR